MADELSLHINGNQYEGWKSLTVTRSIEACAGSFKLGVTDRWSDTAKLWPIRPGNGCKVKIDGETIITGFVDDDDPAFDEESRSISVGGRDKTADLVDCSTKVKTWYNVDLKQIAEDVAAPFGVGVVVATDIGPKFPNWSVNGSGEKAFECIDRAARIRGVLIYPDGKGNIVLGRAGTKRAGTKLIQGKNVKGGSASFSNKDRYSIYTVRSQLAALKDDELPAEISSRLKGQATDGEITRYRPLDLQSEAQSEFVDCKTRAQWEAATRAGKSRKVMLRVKGFHKDDGRLWTPNELAPVKAPWLHIYQEIELLISTVHFTRDGKGSWSLLELQHPDAFKLLPKITRDQVLSALIAQDGRA
jgi:prophage tail gpP-like protein